MKLRRAFFANELQNTINGNLRINVQALLLDYLRLINCQDGSCDREARILVEDKLDEVERVAVDAYTTARSREVIFTDPSRQLDSITHVICCPHVSVNSTQIVKA